MSVETNTESGPITDPLYAADQNTRKSLEVQRRILSAIESAGPQGLGFRPCCRKANVSPSTLKKWLPKFQQEQLVMMNPLGKYVFNDKHPRPVTLAAFTVKLPRPP